MQTKTMASLAKHSDRQIFFLSIGVVSHVILPVSRLSRMLHPHSRLRVRQLPDHKWKRRKKMSKRRPSKVRIALSHIEINCCSSSRVWSKEIKMTFPVNPKSCRESTTSSISHWRWNVNIRIFMKNSIWLIKMLKRAMLVCRAARNMERLFGPLKRGCWWVGQTFEGSAK